ncbi:unnamed protein product [Mycena citricolor]|uniref:Tail specific protease domain-containing protein n=1 Tax=Mycena citricolor TaxID=2018698 RepID=A0AAD2K6L8_9AGAR|nr:unnamed protein product [Mycena citricolor]
MLVVFSTLFLAGLEVSASLSVPVEKDPCAAIAGQKWVSPAEARACMFSFPVDEAVKASTLDTLNKTLAFHTSVNYQILAPAPFQDEVHEDIVADLARIAQTSYDSDFSLHFDVYSSFRRLNDGHCAVLNMCYDSLYVTYLPTPLVLLTSADGTQAVHIAPEAFTVASAEFPDQIDFWQQALSSPFKGQLESLSGAEVLEINGQDPFVAVNSSARVVGGYQAFGTRQNLFFSNYQRVAGGWSYNLGNFATHIHPLTDSVELTIRLVNSSSIEHVTIPYRSRFGSASSNFTDSNSYRANNCVAKKSSNGYDLYDPAAVLEHSLAPPLPIPTVLQQQKMRGKRHAVNEMLDLAPLINADLPEQMLPTPVALNESYSVAQFYLLEDELTGVLALGSFSAPSFEKFMESLLLGLQALKAGGAERLVVDVSNNGGGYICIAHVSSHWCRGMFQLTDWTVAASDYCRTKEHHRAASRAIHKHPRTSLAQLIVEAVNKGGDPESLLSYNPTHWHNATHLPFSVDSHWLRPTVNLTINGREDTFSPRLGNECQPFEMAPPEEALFDPTNVVIMSNGRCGSSCSLFSITMAKHEGVKTVVVGGHQDVRQQYCGVVGGQSTNYVEIDKEIKASSLLLGATLSLFIDGMTSLPDSRITPSPLLTCNVTNSYMGITWRLGFGIDDETQPEEWQDHPADYNLPLTLKTVNKPSELWKYVAQTVFTTETELGPESAQSRFSV